jgi:F-type H+-transporting ATPase subunit b
MHNSQLIKRLLLVVLVLASMLMVSAVAFAQEATPAAEGETHSEAAAPAEGEAHSEEGAAEEAAPATSPLTPLGINMGFLVAQLINFGIVFFLMWRFGWPAIARLLDERAAKIQKGLEDANIAANARKNAEAEAETIRSNARSEIAKAIEEGRGRGEDVRKQIIAEANAEAERLRADARASAETERNAQLAGLRGQIAAISMAATNKLIGESLDSKKASSLIDTFFASVPKSALQMGGSVEVVSAMPLSDSEQSKVKSETGASDVKFIVDPSILGGLIVRSGERVVDGSVRNGLSELAGRLN